MDSSKLRDEAEMDGVAKERTLCGSEFELTGDGGIGWKSFVAAVNRGGGRKYGVAVDSEYARAGQEVLKRDFLCPLRRQRGKLTVYG